MKQTLFVLVVCAIAYKGCAQKHSLIVQAYYPQIQDTIEWSEREIIHILENGKIIFCKFDEEVEVGNPDSYIKNMGIELDEDSVFQSVYVESSICYGEKKQGCKTMRCTYLIMNDKFGSYLEITEDALKNLPMLSAYLDKKLKKTKQKKSEEYIFLDGKTTLFK